MRPNIETHYKDITSHFQKADNNLHQSTPIDMDIYTNLHQSTPIDMDIYTNLHQSTPIYTYRHGYLHQSTPIDMDIYTNLHKAVLRLSRLFSWQI